MFKELYFIVNSSFNVEYVLSKSYFSECYFRVGLCDKCLISCNTHLMPSVYFVVKCILCTYVLMEIDLYRFVL